MIAAATVNSSTVTRGRGAWAAFAVGLCLIYWVIFIATEEMSAGAAWLTAVSNVAPLVVLAWLARKLLLERVLRQPPLLQIVWQAILAINFAVGWYAGSRLCVALAGTAIGYPFRVTGFSGPALAWQLFQGLVLYAAVAAITHAQRSPHGTTEINSSTDAGPLQRYLVRSGEGFHPIDVEQIITITGAQDYSEVTTAESRHLVRLSLGEFESRLDRHRFIRVHRSTIIHVAHLERAELAGGGRMLAFMSNGESVAVSRSGVKALRTLIV